MSTERPHIEVLLERIQDPQLRDQLAAEVEALSGKRKFGLVYESHAPEAIRIPGAPIKRDSTVQFTHGDDQRVWKVLRARAGKANLVHQDGDRLTDVPITDLIVARQLGDPVYPGLTPLGSIEKGGDKPHHLVIQGENYHALQTLLYTHKESVDLIYIDPPYNTGAGDWIYNDRYVGDSDAYRHSKWLSFMEKRLELARKLLKPTGVIIVAIDDNEHHRLRMLLDQEFGEKNFIANVVWQGGRKNDSRFVSNGADYMLLYGKSLEALTDFGVRWREEKPALQEIMAAADAAWEGADGEALLQFAGAPSNSYEVRYRAGEIATERFKKWWKSLPKDHPAQGSKHYNHIDGWSGRPFFPDNTSWPGGGGPVYDVLHPLTGKPVPVPSRGWLFQKEKMSDLIEINKIHFGKDHSRGPNQKSFLDEISGQVADSVFYRDRRAASVRLRSTLAAKDFPFPKDADVIARWVNIATSQNPDAVILDFFAGTGTTAEAVMQLNRQDGGRRQAIIVTNNELAKKDSTKLTKAGHHPGDPEWEAHGVFEKVTRPRIETVVTGVRPDGTLLTEMSANGVGKPIKDATGYEENVSFVKLEYLTRDSIELGEAFRQVAPLLWVKAGSVGPMITEQADTFTFTDHYGVLFNPDRGAGFDEEAVRRCVHMVFIITDSVEVYGAVRRTIPEEIKAVHLYRNYLSNFEINTRKAI